MMFMPLMFTFFFLWAPSGPCHTGSSATSGRLASSVTNRIIVGPPSKLQAGLQTAIEAVNGRRPSNSSGSDIRTQGSELRNLLTLVRTRALSECRHSYDARRQPRRVNITGDGGKCCCASGEGLDALHIVNIAYRRDFDKRQRVIRSARLAPRQGPRAANR